MMGAMACPSLAGLVMAGCLVMMLAVVLMMGIVAYPGLAGLATAGYLVTILKVVLIGVRLYPNWQL
jgi:hypothetical protein